MRTVFEIREPAVLSRCRQLAACIKLAVAFDETMENVEEIGGADRINISAFRNDSSHLYNTKFGFPLSINCHITNTRGKTVTWVHTELYVKEEAGEALSRGCDPLREKFVGDVETVVKSLSAAILKNLQSQFSSSIYP